MEEKTSSNIWKNFGKTLIIFAIFELAIQLIGPFIMGPLWQSLTSGKYSFYLVSEMTVILLALILLFIRKRWSIFKEKRINFKDALKLGMPILIISIVMLASGIIETTSKMNWGNFISMTLYCAAIGFFEEVFFRGILQNELLENNDDTRKKVILSIIFSSLIFSSVHATNLLVGQDLLTTLMQVVQTFAIGVLLGGIYYISNNIWGVIFLHGFYDFSVMLSSVNLIKDCGYVSKVPFYITISMLVASIILSIVYLLYSTKILSKSSVNKVLNIETTEEEIKKEQTKEQKAIKLIWFFVVAFFIFNISYNLIVGDKVNKYYICYEYEEKEFDKLETHYFNYDEFTINKNNLNYNFYLKDGKVLVNSDAFKSDISLNIENAERVISYDNWILIVTNELTNYKVYYSEYFKNNEEFNINDFNKSFKSIDVPEVASVGYLKDVLTDAIYPMFKSSINDIFIIEDNKAVLVK